MFPLKMAYISPHPGGGPLGALNLRSLKEKLPQISTEDIISSIFTVFGITILSGVCYLTLCQAHPILAYEGDNDYISFRTRAEFLSKEEIETMEYENWVKKTNEKYKGYTILRPAKGIAHVKMIKKINNRQVKLNVIEINPKANSKIQIKPRTASSNTLNTRTNIRNIANVENSVVAINGGYFKPQTGVPLGTLVIDKNVLTGPIYNRVALGINSDNTFAMDKSFIDITIKGKKTTIKADNINQPRMLSTYTIVYTDKWGKTAPPAPKYGMAIAIKDGTVVNYNYGSIAIPEGGFAIVGPKQSIASILNDKNIKMDIKFTEAFKESEHIIGGGPYLVKEGQTYVDISEQKFGAINGRNPRTAIGYTKNNELIIVIADGREETSIGMTLWEIAKVMQNLGCEYAMNLDGGSSSVVYIKGKIENSPPYREGIPISNAIVVNEVTPDAVANLKNPQYQ